MLWMRVSHDENEDIIDENAVPSLSNFIHIVPLNRRKEHTASTERNSSTLIKNAAKRRATATGKKTERKTEMNKTGVEKRRITINARKETHSLRGDS